MKYVEPETNVVSADSAVLRSGWRMNKAAGVIHEELWALQPDGSAKPRLDDFEAQA